MSKSVVIHQPDFAPYLGFFHRFLQADLYIVLDHVQFVTGTSRSWTHRDKIKTPAGEKWLTLSVRKAPLDTPINRVELSDAVDWAGGNLNLLRQNYRRAAFFGEIMPLVEALYRDPPPLMADFNLRSINLLADLFDVRIPQVRSATLDPQGSKNALLVDLLRKVEATRYISGVGARDYMDTAVFAAAGIEVVWQDFRHPVYPQQFEGFVPYLSSLDVLFNCGIDGARRLLREIS
ncbi:MAG: WbqC family protein [Rhodospirillaceae bacterium]